MLTPVSDDLADRLRAALPAPVFRDPEPRYFEEPRGRWTGGAGLVLAPGSTEEVALILRAAAETGTPVIPRGGGTGLVGGQVPVGIEGGILLSMERMGRIRGVYPQENVITVEAGATVAAVQAAAEAADRLFPLSYGAEGTAQIGGALAVNSGGLNVLRYGTARELCLGLEAVLPDGSVWNGLRRLRKDNTGYDLRNLMIGAEGTLGIITAASLRLFPRPRARATAVLAVPGPAAALALLARARDLAGETVSGFELISGQGPRFMAEAGLPGRFPLDPVPDWSVLMEIATGAGDPVGMMESLFEAAYGAGEVTDGAIASSEAQRDAFWGLREAIPEANRLIGAVASHDIALPLSKIPAFLDEAPRRIAAIAPVRINAFGHLGDGNLHFNVFPRAGEDRSLYEGQRAEISRAVHDLVAEMEGSFSAEHGVGRLKTGDLGRYGDKLAAMRAIKGALDPKGIMNPAAMRAIKGAQLDPKNSTLNCISQD